MTDNPLDDSDGKRNALIEKRAYHLWEADGRPHGQHDEFWERASELVRMEEAAGFGQLPNPATVPGADPSRVQPVEEAFIQENLGEFPDRFADQGEAQPTPKPKRAARAKLADELDTGAAGPAADKPVPQPAASKSRKSTSKG